MLNKTLKLIRIVKGYNIRLVSLEIGKTPQYINRIETGTLSIPQKVLESFSLVYQMPISKIENISLFYDKNDNISSVINEISKYYIIKEQNEIFNTEDLKYVFEMPESPLKLIRIMNEYTIKEASKYSDVSISTINKVEQLMTNTTDRTINKLSNVYNIQENVVKELIKKQNETSRAELFYMISNYYMNENNRTITSLEKSLGSIKYVK